MWIPALHGSFNRQVNVGSFFFLIGERVTASLSTKIHILEYGAIHIVAASHWCFLYHWNVWMERGEERMNERAAISWSPSRRKTLAGSHFWEATREAAPPLNTSYDETCSDQLRRPQRSYFQNETWMRAEESPLWGRSCCTRCSTREEEEAASPYRTEPNREEHRDKYSYLPARAGLNEF